MKKLRTPLLERNKLGESSLVHSKIKLLKYLCSSNKANNEPILTIVVAAYCHEQFIDDCLESINKCNIENLEVIIIDDGSLDQTLSKCINYNFAPNITVRIYGKHNSGLVDSLWHGLNLARGDYVAFIASDDCYECGAIELALASLKNNTIIDALICQAKMFGDKNGLVYDTRINVFFSSDPFARLDKILLSPPAPMLIQSSIFKRTFLLKLNPWDNNLKLDDWPFFIGVFVAEAYQGAIVKYAPEICLAKYRIHSSGAHLNLNRQLQLTEEVAIKFIPLKYRKQTLANIRIDIGFGNLRNGRWAEGIMMCIHGLLTIMTFQNFMSFITRVANLVKRKILGKIYKNLS